MNNTVLITGASGGIGSATARRLQQDGFEVLLHYNASAEKAAALSAELGGAPAFHADFTRPEEIEAMFREIDARFGGVDALVNNAGIPCYGLITDVRPEDWRRLFAVNVDGMYNCCRLAIPHMVRSKHGSIVNVSSIWGLVGASCEAAYSAAKGAITAFSKALAKELAPSGIRVNCAAPGVILTDMLKPLSAETLELVRQETPLGVLGRPEDVAELIAFLLSERAAFITGQVISPNGGFVVT